MYTVKILLWMLELIRMLSERQVNLTTKSSHSFLTLHKIKSMSKFRLTFLLIPGVFEQNLHLSPEKHFALRNFVRK